jgi:hypothetical protein
MIKLSRILLFCLGMVTVSTAAFAQGVGKSSGAPIQGTSPGVDPTAGNILGVQNVTGNTVSGTANTTRTSTTSLVAFVAIKKLYITSFSCANTGTTTSLVSFQDGSAGATLWTTIVPAGGGSNLGGPLPLFRTTAGNGLFFAAGSASTTVYCSAAGFSGA